MGKFNVIGVISRFDTQLSTNFLLFEFVISDVEILWALAPAVAARHAAVQDCDGPPSSSDGNDDDTADFGDFVDFRF